MSHDLAAIIDRVWIGIGIALDINHNKIALVPKKTMLLIQFICENARYLAGIIDSDGYCITGAPDIDPYKNPIIPHTKATPSALIEVSTYDVSEFIYSTGYALRGDEVTVGEIDRRAAVAFKD
jgi:hypothetical protein